jgi:adenosylcobinamide-phosphate synthase
VLLGDPTRLHPVAGFGDVALALERRIWADSRRRGALFTLLLVAGTGAASRVATSHLRGWRRVLFETATLWCTLGGRSLDRAAHAMWQALAAGDVAAARELAPTLVGRDTANLGTSDLARATIESVAENMGDAIVAPLFFFAIGGAPAVAAYRATNTLDAIVGHRSDRHRRFGWASARLDDLLNLVPARLGAAMAALAAAADGRGPSAIATLRADGHRHPSPNAGLYEAVFAGALGVKLGGENRYGGIVEHRPTLGSGRAPQPDDILAAIVLARRAAMLAAFAFAAALELRRRV